MFSIVQQVTKDQCSLCRRFFGFLFPAPLCHKTDFLLLHVTKQGERSTKESICQEISLATKASNNLFKFQSHLGDLTDHDFWSIVGRKDVNS
jgi:hypothetical protein